MKKYSHSLIRSAQSEKAKFKKRIAAVMVANMLCMSVIPAVVSAEQTTQVATVDSTATETSNAAGTSTAKVPSADTLGLDVKSAILMEASTGQILMSVNADQAYAPASMTKMMTEYIVSEKVKQGEISWDDVVTVSENASLSVGSRVYLAEGDQHTVRELYIAMAIGSANDATVALAEYVATSEQEFVKLMNAEAQRMGMTDTYFINSTGLNRADMPEKYRPEEDRETVMTAKDVAILTRYIVEDHPDFAEVTSLQSYDFRGKDKIINWNWMLEENKNITNFKQYAYEGLDGMKTGHTSDAGYCFAGTAERDGMRLISVVMGAKTQPARFTETKKVLDYGFNNFELKQVVAAKTAVTGAETAPVEKGKESTVPVVTENAVSFIVPKGTETIEPEFTVNFEGDGLVAPVEAGTKAGTITYTYKVEGMDETQEQTVNLITSEKVEKAGWFRLMFRAIGDFFGDMFDSIKNLF